MNRRVIAIVVSVVVSTVVAIGQSAPPEAFGPSHPESVARAARAKAARERAEERLASAKDKFAQARALAHKVRDNLRQKTGRVDVSADALQKAAARLEEELDDLRLDAVAGEARMAAIEKTVAEVVARGKEAAKRDEVAAELEAVVAARQEALARKQKLFETGQAAGDEVQAARAMVAEARAKLAERRQGVNGAGGGAAAGGAALSEWNREMFNLAHDAEERRARVKYLSERLDRLTGGLGLLDQLTDATEAMHAAEARVAEAQRELRNLERRADDVDDNAASPQGAPSSKGGADGR